MAGFPFKNRINTSSAGTGIEFSEPTTRGIEEFTRPAEEYPRPKWDQRPMPPEIVAPGEYQWSKPGVKRNQAVKLMAWVTAVVLSLINMNILSGSMAKTFAELLNIEASVTLTERNSWDVKAISYEDKSTYQGPVDILFRTDSLDGEATILFDQSEPSSENTFRLRLMVDGNFIDISQSKIYTSTSEGDGSEEIHYYSDVYILLPDGFDKTAEHEIKLYVYQYIDEDQSVHETISDIAF